MTRKASALGRRMQVDPAGDESIRDQILPEQGRVRYSMFVKGEQVRLFAAQVVRKTIARSRQNTGHWAAHHALAVCIAVLVQHQPAVRILDLRHQIGFVYLGATPFLENFTGDAQRLREAHP
jgi:hypothetical protein